MSRSIFKRLEENSAIPQASPPPQYFTAFFYSVIDLTSSIFTSGKNLLKNYPLQTLLSIGTIILLAAAFLEKIAQDKQAEKIKKKKEDENKS